MWVAEFKVGNLSYKSWEWWVVSVRAANSKDSCIEVPKTVNYQGMTYKIDEIEKKAFANQPDLRKLGVPGYQVPCDEADGGEQSESAQHLLPSALPPVIGNAIWKTRIQGCLQRFRFQACHPVCSKKAASMPIAILYGISLRISLNMIRTS